MYRSGCTETVHIMSVQCTEVVHLYVPKWSYQSGPPHVPKWSCTELVLPRCTTSSVWQFNYSVNKNGTSIGIGSSSNNCIYYCTSLTRSSLQSTHVKHIHPCTIVKASIQPKLYVNCCALQNKKLSYR